MVPEIEILMPKYTKNLILNPSFENNIAGWVETPFTDGKTARLEIGQLIGYSGFYGMACAPDGLAQTANAFVTNFGGAAVKEFRAGFLLDLNDYTMSAGSTHSILIATGACGIQLNESAGVIRFRAFYDDDAGTNTTAFVNVPFPGVSSFEIQYVAADNPGDNDGIFRLWLDGTLTFEVLNIDNDTKSNSEARFGFPSAPNAANTGSFYMDNCFWYATVGDFVIVEPTLERARFGRKSLKIQTPGSNNSEGVYGYIDTTGINGPVVGSAYVRGSGKIRLRLIDGATGGQYISQEHQLHDRYWQRLSVEGITVGGDDYRMYIETIGTVPQEETLYVDAAQIEEGGVLTSYCDGDQEGCFWNGVLHASTSERESTSMAGGEWVPWRDDECDPDSYYTEVSGFGMPPVTLNRQSMALTAGSFYDSTRIEERVLIINSFFRDTGAQKRKGGEIKHLFELRQRIEDLVKPDNNPSQDPFWLRFGQDGKWLYIQAHYETGMEFDLDVRNKWTNASSLRFLAMQPYFTEDSQETALLEFGQELGDGLYYAMRVDGEWQLQLNGLNNEVNALEFDENERLYTGGTFTADDDGIDIRRAAVANDDYSSLAQVGAGFVNGRVHAIATHPNGKIYLGGTFTQDGDGNVYGLVAEYDPATGVFDNLGGGLAAGSQIVRDVKVSPTGNIYFAGGFSTAGGAPAFNIAYWDGGAWHTVGNIVAEAGSSIIRKIVVISDDEIYAAGTDTNTGALFLWDGSTWSLIYDDPESSGGVVSQAAILGSDGSIIFGIDGVFGAGRLAKLFRYNGATAEQLGPSLEGSTPQIRSLDEDSLGNIYLGTTLVSNIGSLVPEGSMFIWNGSSYVLPDIQLDPEFSGNGMEIRIRNNDDIYIGFNGGGSVSDFNSASITNLNNIGTAQVFPIISVVGPGKIIWIENQTTKQIAYMNYTTQENELLEIDFRTGEKTVTSNYAGSVPDAILPNSEDILLAAGTKDTPKSNKFAVLIVDAVNPTVQLRYTPTHWSIDALDML
jgi:hypothetical protein